MHRSPLAHGPGRPRRASSRDDARMPRPVGGLARPLKTKGLEMRAGVNCESGRMRGTTVCSINCLQAIPLLRVTGHAGTITCEPDCGAMTRKSQSPKKPSSLRNRSQYHFVNSVGLTWPSQTWVRLAVPNLVSPALQDLPTSQTHLQPPAPPTGRASLRWWPTV